MQAFLMVGEPISTLRAWLALDYHLGDHTISSIPNRLRILLTDEEWCADRGNRCRLNPR